MALEDIKPKAVLIFGPPGSGKGTVSDKLKAITDIHHVSTGDIFRGLSPESENGKLFYKYSNEGKLVPDEVTVKIFARFVEGLIDTNVYNPSKKILLLDGIPRTPEQAEIINKYVNVEHIINLEIKDEQEIVNRILGRAAEQGRKDDADESIIRNRISEYKNKTAAVLDKYSDDIIANINGQQSPLRVFADVLEDWINYIQV